MAAGHRLDAVLPEEEYGVKLMKHAGQWVAVTEQTVVQSASTLNELLERVAGSEQRVSILSVSTLAQSTRPGSTRRLDLETYDRLVTAGALDGEPLELLDGMLLDVSPHSPAHAAVLRRIMRHIEGTPGWSQAQLPLEVPPDSAPEPDLALLAHEPPAGHHPRTALFVVEVAVTSHAVDRGLKVELYARAGVPVYWIVDVPARTIEVRTEPGRDGYAHRESYGPGARVPAPAPGVSPLEVSWVFELVAE